MPRYRYFPETLAAAAARARSVTAVMRLLGVRVSGGSHRRRPARDQSSNRPLILEKAGLTTPEA